MLAPLLRLHPRLLAQPGQAQAPQGCWERLAPPPRAPHSRLVPEPAASGRAIPKRGSRARQARRVWRRQDGLFRELFRRFFAQLFGSAVLLSLQRSLTTHWTPAELAYPWLLSRRVLRYMPHRRRRGRRIPIHPWRHGVLALTAALRTRDPGLLLAWVQTRVRRMSLFGHRRFFRIFGVLLRTALGAVPSPFGLRGLYIYLVGKISVTGNARSRAFQVIAGSASGANLTLRVTQALGIVRTRTGCLGLTLRFYF